MKDNTDAINREILNINEITKILKDTPIPKFSEEEKSLRHKKWIRDLELSVNCNSKENGSNTPDFIVAEYMNDCLEALNKTIKSREEWYGHKCSIGGCDHKDKDQEYYNASVEDLVKAIRREVECLAKSLYEQHYKKENPNWVMKNDTIGILLQISNMVAGMERTNKVETPSTKEQAVKTPYQIAYDCLVNISCGNVNSLPRYSAEFALKQIKDMTEKKVKVEPKLPNKEAWECMQCCEMNEWFATKCCKCGSIGWNIDGWVKE